MTGALENKRKNLEQKMLDRIKSSQSYAPLLKRLISFILDYCISSVFVSIIPLLITSIVTQETGYNIETFTAMPLVWQLVSSVCAFVLAVYYFCIYPMKEKHRGQTIGKKLMKIKIVSRDGNPLTMKQILYREVIGSFLVEGETAFPSAFVRYFLYMLLPAAAAGPLSMLAVGISVFSVLWAIFGKEHRMIHDRIAGTVVVPANK